MGEVQPNCRDSENITLNVVQNRASTVLMLCFKVTSIIYSLLSEVYVCACVVITEFLSNIICIDCRFVKNIDVLCNGNGGVCILCSVIDDLHLPRKK